MEEKDVLIEEIMLKVKQDKSKISILVWMNFLRKSWPVYIIMILFTILFTILHIISGSLFQFYLSIFYPIVMLLILIGEGIYKNRKALKALKTDFKIIQVDIYPTYIKLTNQIKGINHSSELPYDVIERMFYQPSTNEFIFEVRKESHFSIPRNLMKEETFQFLMSLTHKEEDIKEE